MNYIISQLCLIILIHSYNIEHCYYIIINLYYDISY
jgi:hypothetical protein